jgi:hypothetical protein
MVAPYLAVALFCSGIGCGKDREPAVASAKTPTSGGAPKTSKSKDPPALVWPLFPKTADQARALIAKHARPARPTAILSQPTSAQTIGALLAAHRRGQLWVGRRAVRDEIDRWLKKDGVILYGTYHDSPLQVSVFADLIGPDGLRRLDAVVVEQFDADGRWRGVKPAEQTGDDRLLARYARSGTLEALSALRTRQRALNYTAWKYDYLTEMMRLPAMARARGLPLFSCDMPRAAQKKLENVAGDHMKLRLRELHCALALKQRQRRQPVGRIAMLWGQDHVAARGVERFLPRQTRVLAIYVYGGRRADHGLEKKLSAKLAIAAPVLLPLPKRHARRDERILLLPGRLLAAQVDRVRLDHKTRPRNRTQRLTVYPRRAGTMLFAGQRIAVTKKGKTISMRVSSSVRRPYVWQSGAHLMVGSLPSASTIELWLSAKRRKLRVQAGHGSSMRAVEPSSN